MTTQTLAQPATSFSLSAFFRQYVLPNLLESALPLACYFLVKQGLHTSDFTALVVSACVPVLNILISWLRTHRLSIISIFVLIGMVASLAISFISGSPQVLLIRESFITGLFGLIFLVSLAMPRPLFFLMARHMRAGNDPAKLAFYEQQWQNATMRRRYRLITAVWAVVLLGELALRITLILTLPVATVVTLLSIIPFFIYIGTVAWTIRYIRKPA